MCQQGNVFVVIVISQRGLASTTNQEVLFPRTTTYTRVQSFCGRASSNFVRTQNLKGTLTLSTFL